MKPGDTLPSVHKTVIQERVREYAQASGDHNPLHLDAEFAATTQYGRIVVHGMLVMAYISEMMALAFGRSWLDGGRLKVRFRAPVYPGDHITTFGEVRKVAEADGHLRLDCSVGCRNQGGEEVINGEASVIMPGENSEDSNQ